MLRRRNFPVHRARGCFLSFLSSSCSSSSSSVSSVRISASADLTSSSSPCFSTTSRPLLQQQAVEFGDEEDDVWNQQREQQQDSVPGGAAGYEDEEDVVGAGAHEDAIYNASSSASTSASASGVTDADAGGEEQVPESPQHQRKVVEQNEAAEAEAEAKAATLADALLRDFGGDGQHGLAGDKKQRKRQEKIRAADGSAATLLRGGATPSTAFNEEEAFMEEEEQDQLREEEQKKQQQQRLTDEDLLETRRRRELGSVLHSIVANYTPGPPNSAFEGLLAECKNSHDLSRIVEQLIRPNPGMHDIVNGHGFRVFVFGKVAAASAKLGDTGPWLRLMRLVRARGFRLTRTYIAYFLETLRKETSQRFVREGRNPQIAADIISATRSIIRFAEEDGVALDWVLMSRVLFVVTGVVAAFDRQNIYRSNWPSSGELPRREGIVAEWVIAHDRPADYDRVVQLCDGVVDDLVADVKNRFRCRPPFSFVMRLADYYFATDNAERMLATLEDALDSGVPIGESSTAKMMQIVCGFNFPQVPRIFLKFRVMQAQCMLVGPDFSRIMMWYCRSGGGRPCPECGEPYNHRNVSVSQWQRNTTPQQRRCSMLHNARMRRGELENNPAAPQCRDWSREAMQLYELSQARAISWSPVEWRAFVMCHMFAPSDKALEALALLEDSLERTSWDEFLAAQVMRLLRHHAPERIIPTLRRWHALLSGTGDENNMDFQTRATSISPTGAVSTSPLVVQEAAMGVVRLDSAEERIAALNYLTEAATQCEIYSMAYTQRVLRRRMQELTDVGAISEAEQDAIQSFCNITPRAIGVADMKDSCSDIKPVGNKRSIVYGSK